MNAWIIMNEAGKFLGIDIFHESKFLWVDRREDAMIFCEQQAPGVVFGGGKSLAEATLSHARIEGKIVPFND